MMYEERMCITNENKTQKTIRSDAIKSFLKTLDNSELKEYTEEQRKNTDKKIEIILDQFTKEKEESCVNI